LGAVRQGATKPDGGPRNLARRAWREPAASADEFEKENIRCPRTEIYQAHEPSLKALRTLPRPSGPRRAPRSTRYQAVPGGAGRRCPSSFKTTLAARRLPSRMRREFAPRPGPRHEARSSLGAGACSGPAAPSPGFAQEPVTRRQRPHEKKVECGPRDLEWVNFPDSAVCLGTLINKHAGPSSPPGPAHPQGSGDSLRISGGRG